MLPAKRALRFTAVIYQVGINRCVDIPPRVQKELKLEGYLSVMVSLGGDLSETTIVPGRGGYRVYLRSNLRNAAEVDTGDKVSVSVVPRRSPSTPRLPTDLAAALKKQKAARVAFSSLTPRLRRDMIAMVNQARTPQTRKKRILHAVELLKERSAKSSRKGFNS